MKVFITAYKGKLGGSFCTLKALKEYLKYMQDEHSGRVYIWVSDGEHPFCGRDLDSPHFKISLKKKINLEELERSDPEDFM